MLTNNQNQAKQFLAKEVVYKKTQDCVRCGLCLPHCPTFNHKKDERYSPRGRIMMMQAYSQSELDLSQADEYLSNCLNCLNCQSMCPAKVDYQSLIHQFHVEKIQNFANQKSKTFTSIFTHPFGNRMILIFSRLAHFFHLSFFAQFLKPSFLKTALYSTLLVDFVQPRRVKRKGFLFNQDQLTNQQKLILFAGCCAGFNQSTLDKASLIFTRMGLEVEKMTHFGCCGALSFYQGDEKRAIKIEQNLYDKFENNSLVLVVQSGCIGYIQSKKFEHNISNVKDETKVKYQDLSSFLFRQLSKSNLKFKKWQYGKVLLHLPCSQRYPLDSSIILDLMKKIEGLNPQVVDWGCCGSAGSYLFSNPIESEQLGNQMIDEIEDKLKLQIADYQYLITTNIGCKIQFNQILASKKQQKNLKIVHPIEIFADLIKL